jgi:hypothetical protein
VSAPRNSLARSVAGVDTTATEGGYRSLKAQHDQAHALVQLQRMKPYPDDAAGRAKDRSERQYLTDGLKAAERAMQLCLWSCRAAGVDPEPRDVLDEILTALDRITDAQ